MNGQSVSPQVLQAARALQQELAGLTDLQVLRLASPSDDLSLQVRMALDLGVPLFATEIREKATRAARKYLKPGDWVLGAAFQEKMHLPNFGTSPRHWALVTDAGFILSAGSSLFFAEPEEVQAEATIEVNVYPSGPDAMCSWRIVCGTFMLSGLMDPRLPSNNVATAILLQQELLTGEREKPT